MAIHGVRLTDNFSPAEVRPKNWREGILLLKPNGSAPLLGLTSGMKSESCDDPEFNWFEKEISAQRFAGTNNLLVGGTSITHAAGAAFNAGVRINSIIWIEGSTTRELVRVSGGASAGVAVTVADTNVTIVRGWGGTTAAAHDFTNAANNPNITVVGSANEENSDSPRAVQFDPTRRTNFTQIFRDTLEASRTAMKTRLRTGDSVREAKRETLELHAMQIEKALFFGRGQESGQSLNGAPARTTYGIVHWLAAFEAGNIVANPPATAVTFAVLEGWLEQVFRYGSQEKMGFLGNRAMLTISRAVRLATNTALTIGPGEKEFGMNVRRLLSPFGTLVLKTHPIFNMLTTSAGAAWAGYDSSMVVLDMENFKYRYLKESDTQYQPKLQNNGIDGMKSGYLTECGLEIHHPKTHFVVTGMAVAAAG